MCDEGGFSDFVLIGRDCGYLSRRSLERGNPPGASCAARARGQRPARGKRTQPMAKASSVSRTTFSTSP